MTTEERLGKLQADIQAEEEAASQGKEPLPPSAVPPATDQPPPVQSSPDPNQPPPEPDRIQEAIAAGIAAERDKLREELKQELLTESRDTSRRQSVEGLTNDFRSGVRQARAELGKVTWLDAEGNENKLTEDDVTRILKPVDDYNSKVYTTAEQLVYANVEDAIHAVLPEAIRPDFIKAADGKPLKDFMTQFLEHGALSTAAVKNMTLEDAEAASPKLKAAVAALRASEFEKGRVKGKAEPVTEPTAQERSAASQSGSYPLNDDGKIDTARALAQINGS